MIYSLTAFFYYSFAIKVTILKICHDTEYEKASEEHGS